MHKKLGYAFRLKIACPGQNHTPEICISSASVSLQNRVSEF